MAEKTIKLTDSQISDLLQGLSRLSLDNKSFSVLQKKLNKAVAKTPIKVASRKAKGRNLQKWAVEKIARLLGEPLTTDTDSNNIRSREMGQSGVDVWIHKTLRSKFPIAVECKAQEQVSLPAFIEQARNNTSSDMPYWLLVLKNKALKNPVIVMDWDLLEWLYLSSKWNN